MKIKYRSGYAEGGFLDDGATVDPMSGNEVPVGSLQEEVRDDIPAQLSEGEFVVPADVVRFIGLDKLMKMRDSAKKGLAEMEAEGQIGGSDIPPEMPPEMGMGAMQEEAMDIDAMIDGMEDDGMDFAEGGYVQREDGSWEIERATTTAAAPPSYADLMGHNFGSVPTTETLTYINAEGHKVYIPVVDGKPAFTPPEGYTVVGAEEEEVADVVTPEEELDEAAPAINPNKLSSGEKAQKAKDIASSNRLQRDNISKLEGMAGPDMTEAELTTMYGHLSTKAKAIYDDRFRDTKGLDSLMAKGLSPVDLMIKAQETANTLNNKAGIIEYNDTDTYDTGGTDFKKFAKVAAAALVGGIPGLLTVAKIKEKGIDDPGIVATIKKYIADMGKGSGNTGDAGTQPIGETATVYDQAHWRKRLSENATQEEMAAEMAELQADTGYNAYGNKLTAAEVIAANKLKAKKHASDTKQRTIDRDTLAREVDTATTDRAAQTAAERAAAIARNAAASAVDNVVNDTGSRSGPPGMYDEDEKDKVKVKTAAEEAGYAGVSGGGGRAKGGLLTKADRPKIKKMRNDNTSGLASKKKSKERAKAKKGALAAKRT